MSCCTPSDSRVSTLVRELLTKVRTLKAALDSYRTIAGDMPATQPVFAELFIRERVDDSYFVTFVYSSSSFYDIEESVDGVRWFLSSRNPAVDTEGGVAYWRSADYSEEEHPVFFRVIRRASERVLCCPPSVIPPPRIGEHLIGVCAPYGSTNCGSEFPLCSDPLAVLS